MSAALKPARMSVAEFLTWDSDDLSGRRWQLVDGEPVAMAPASSRHGSIQSELARLIGNHLLESGSQCRAVTAPGIVPGMRAAENWRIPDLGVTCAADNDAHAMPAPVLLVEILSPSNQRQTRANIWTYTTIRSLREILVVHSTRIEAEFLQRLPDGTWPADPLVLRDGDSLTLASVGLTLPVRAIYRTTSLAA